MFRLLTAASASLLLLAACQQPPAASPERTESAAAAPEATEALTGVAAAGEGADLHGGVPQQQPEHLTPGVPAGSCHRHPRRRHAA